MVQIHTDIPFLNDILDRSGINETVLDIVPLQGGNNRVYHILTAGGEYVLKHYFVSGTDKRERLISEYAFLRFAWGIGLRNIPKPIYKDVKQKIGVYQYIKGLSYRDKIIGKSEIDRCIDFVNLLNEDQHRFSDAALKLPMASGACLSLQDHLDSVGDRIKKLSRINTGQKIDKAATAFVLNFLTPVWKLCQRTFKEDQNNKKSLEPHDRIISPSDFGFHNAIAGKDETVFFIDFEYAGWDDPVKLICDFFCQPDIPVSRDYMASFTASLTKTLKPEYDMTEKIKSMMPLYRLKWCCIMLNEFLAVDGQRRNFARYNLDRKKEQLNKSVNYFETHVAGTKKEHIFDKILK